MHMKDFECKNFADYGLKPYHPPSLTTAWRDRVDTNPVF